MTDFDKLDHDVRIAAVGVAAAEHARAVKWEDYNEALGQLEDAVAEWASTKGLSVGVTERKNVVALRVADVVTIEFGRQEDELRGFIAIKTDGADFHADRGEVRAEVLIGFVIGAIAAGRSTAPQIDA